MQSQALEDLYWENIKARTPMSHHLPALRLLAAQCKNAVELGVNRGGSTTALLLGCGDVTSYDLVQTRAGRQLATIAGDSWRYRIEDSRTAVPQACDLLFIDSLHTFDQVRDELNRHGDYVRRMIAFHDTVTFGSVGSDGNTGKHAEGVLGIRPAIDLFMASRPAWRIVSHDVESHGFLVIGKGDT